MELSEPTPKSAGGGLLPTEGKSVANLTLDIAAVDSGNLSGLKTSQKELKSGKGRLLKSLKTLR